MKKVCFIIPSLSNGGAERVVSLLSSGISKYDDCQVYILKYFNCKDEYDVSKDVNIISLFDTDEFGYSKISILKKIRKIRSFLKKEKFDYVIPFLTHVAFHCYLAKMFLKKTKTINTIRIVNNSPDRSWLTRVISNHIVKKSYKTFVQNEEQKNYYSKKIQKKVYILPNPVNDEVINNPKIEFAHKKRIIAVGRLAKQKNFKLLINCIKLLKDKYPDVELKIYGDGEEKQNLINYIEDINIGNNVFICGRTNNIYDKYRESDIFVLSSNSEGMPNVLIEAMGLGVPCISTDCPTGPSSIIKNGENGYLVPIDNVNEMFVAIEKLFNNIDIYKQFSVNGRKTVLERYSLETISKEMHNNILV